MSDLATRLPGSAETWRQVPAEPRVPAALLPPDDATVGARLRAWRARHLLRQQRARDAYAASRHPERGLPVASPPAVAAFLRDLLSDRRGMVALLLGLHALAAVAGLL